MTRTLNDKDEFVQQPHRSASVQRYESIPCEIQAIEWTGDNWKEVRKFLSTGTQNFDRTLDGLLINTLEGVMFTRLGDFIIRGTRGEFYPCKPGVFHHKYKHLERTS